MKKILTLVLAIACSHIYAQKINVEQGGFDFLIGQKEVNVEFDYSNLTLLKENLTNDAYVTKRSADLEEKGRGKGQTWAKKWDSSRELIWNPKFIELVNAYLEKKEGIYFSEGIADTKYTLIVEVVWIYPGWDVGIMKQPAKVTTNLKFVETANRDSILLEVSSKNAPGDQYGNNYSNESRVGEGFAKTGKSFGKLVLKKAF